MIMNNLSTDAVLHPIFGLLLHLHSGGCGSFLMRLDMLVEIMLTILRITMMMILKLPAGPICVVSIPGIDQVLHLVLLQQLLQVCGLLVPEVSRLVGCFVREGW